MFIRNALLVLGVGCILGGLAFGYIWFTNQDAPVEEPQPEARAQPAAPKTAVLSAAHDIASGTLLQQADMSWKEIEPSELRPGHLVRGQISEAEFTGALAKRNFASGEALIVSDLLKQSDRGFLASALQNGTRAISIPVDASQSASGLIVPGNRVDVILTQTLTDPPGGAKRKVAAETILQNIRVVAVDQMLAQPGTRASPNLAFSAEPRLPKMVTLELTKRQVEKVIVALQLGRLQLSVRPLDDAAGEEADHAEKQRPTWAGDVSPALKQIPPQSPSPAASSLESAIRRPPASTALQ